MTHWRDFVDPAGPDGAYLPWKKVEARVGISRTTAWRLQKAGEFPRPYVVSPGRVAYRESEVEAWKVSRGHRAAGDRHGRTALPRAERHVQADALSSERSFASPSAAELPLSRAPPPAPEPNVSAPAPRRVARGRSSHRASARRATSHQLSLDF